MIMNDSPYNKANIITYPDGSQSLEPVIEQVILTDKVHTVKEGETLQNIAFQYYRDSGKWYKLVEANKILNPFTEVYPGVQLIIP